jgi:U4/U6.U5 tri-snRNP-associated protein 1
MKKTVINGHFHHKSHDNNDSSTLINSYKGYFTSAEAKELVHDTEALEKHAISNRATRMKSHLHEKTAALGVGVSLSILRSQGILATGGVEWIGRKNDQKSLTKEKPKNNFPSEKNDDKIERLEIALRRTDEYGRILTTKEAFRELCYHFHGKRPSKNRLQKRIKQYVKELASKNFLASKVIIERTVKMLEIQQKLCSPHLLVERTVRK